MYDACFAESSSGLVIHGVWIVEGALPQKTNKQLDKY